VLVPDSEDSGGYNDRMAFMNRAAADAYFGQHSYLQSMLTGSPDDQAAFGNFNTSEQLLRHVITHSGVQLLRFPTVGALRCCQSNRSYCWNSKCFAYCLPTVLSEAHNGRRTVMWLKYEAEALMATRHAMLLGLGLARVEESSSRCLELNASIEAGSDKMQGVKRTPRRGRSLTLDQQPPFDYAFCLDYRDRTTMLRMHEDVAYARQRLACSACEASDSLTLARGTVATSMTSEQKKVPRSRRTRVTAATTPARFSNAVVRHMAMECEKERDEALKREQERCRCGVVS
jgi:hypothetical protein